MDENNGFRRALRNPLLVGGLCLTAGVAVYVNYTESLTSEFVDPVHPLSFPPERTSPDTASSSFLGSPEPAATQWGKPSQRDPFSPAGIPSRLFSHSEPATSGTVSAEPSQPSFQQMALKAIAVDGEVKSAVINRSIVYEGDMVEEFYVLSIEPNGVWLRRGRHKHFLTFAERKVS